ncbi:MAG: thioredoxin-like domain-containing protein [Chthoniobacterales bacterium]
MTDSMKTLLSLFLLIPFTTFASLEELVGPDLINAAGEKVPTSSLAGKVVGLYFSAEWCPPCKAFTPELVKLRDSEAGKFEVIFVSSDRSAEAQQKYMTNYKMNWLAVPHDSPLREQLQQKFGIQGIPSLVIIDDQGNLITDRGRSEMGRGDAAGVLDTWISAAGKQAND